MSNKNLIEVDHLAIGLTKSPMFMGINIRVFFANIVFCFLVCINAHTFLGIPVLIVLHVTFARLSIKEPNFLEIWFKSFFKTPLTFNFRFWGKTNSYEPW